MSVSKLHCNAFCGVFFGGGGVLFLLVGVIFGIHKLCSSKVGHTKEAVSVCNAFCRILNQIYLSIYCQPPFHFVFVAKFRADEIEKSASNIDGGRSHIKGIYSNTS